MGVSSYILTLSTLTRAIVYGVYYIKGIRYYQLFTKKSGESGLTVGFYFLKKAFVDSISLLLLGHLLNQFFNGICDNNINKTLT